MPDTLLRVDRLVKRFGGLIATNSLSLEVRTGELHAVIGPNGAGKTTLISQLFGELLPNSGTIHFVGEDITTLSTSARVHRGLARSFQITQLLFDYSALDNVALAVQARLGHSYHFWGNARRDCSLREPALQGLVDVGLECRANVPVKELSHGEQRQLELAIALATKPRLLLLDEPMAGLGTTECAATIGLLRKLKNETTVLLVEHDMNAVFALADRISVLVNGQCIMTGTSADVCNNESVRIAYLGEGNV
ncbi:branched-chain amino acid ABC transporter substrate-binding protein [Bradyrhizobium sp. LTSPM299]|uniref:ABC transporter ATP-binding protein n=1 Tax=Bradyrhizobium sp. LTSPM299 TaxID=1619233 RepID=UPI0005C87C20|nr:ABC transporter ATP-binding protein [Bradyrhizobium sp. LTSPM299]KJC60329.1 branched-chain amino acid ABC transporter substrate-binding protein [Bradyrhizobium sp. LTSPM299]